jgi:hypothetical protein
MPKKPKPKKRKSYTDRIRHCLGCERPFKSWNPGNRMCRTCRQREIWKSGMEWDVQGIGAWLEGLD